MMVALSVVLMSITTIIPIFMYIIPLLTGLVVLLCEKLSNKKWALSVFFATSLLSLILLTDKESVLTYVLFFGYYPLVRGNLSKLPKVLFVVLKFVLFNCAAVLTGFLGVFLFGVPKEEYTEFGKVTIPILLGLANVVFLIYDAIFKKYDMLFKYAADKLKRTMK